MSGCRNDISSSLAGVGFSMTCFCLQFLYNGVCVCVCVCDHVIVPQSVCVCVTVLLFLRGVDDLLPILSYVIVRSGLPQLVSEAAIMEEFIGEG